MSGDIRSSDSEDLTDSSENARLANGSARSKGKSNSGAAGKPETAAIQRKSHNANNHTTESGGGAASAAASQ